jgi:hypothetical protein
MRKALLVLVMVAFMLTIVNAGVVYAKGRCGGCFFHKVKMVFKKTGAYVNNKIKDGYVAAKKGLTCKKDKVWVKGHCRTDKKGRRVWVKGHWRRIHKSGKRG